MTYIAFLRAINVGGRTVRMEVLRAHFSELGLTNVRSYIQTGNVFFDSSEDREVLQTTIEKRLHEKLGYEVPTIILTITELETALAGDPFKGVMITDDTRLCIAFVTKLITIEKPELSPKGDFEVLSSTPHALQVVVRYIDGKPGNLTVYLEKTYGVKATTRFFHTSLKILEVAR